jgi:hypothetical protein
MIRAAAVLAVWLAVAPVMAQGKPPLEPPPPPPAEPAGRPVAPSPSPPPATLPAPTPPATWYPPPPTQYPWYPPPYAPYPWYPPPPPPPAPPPGPTPPTPASTLDAQPESTPSPGTSPSRASWSLQVESAQGVTPGKFQNTLLAGHLDYAFASRVSLGGYLALASLKGKDRRVNALMPCALVTYEKPPGPDHSISFPIQFATGYLARNGPVARLAAGLAWAIGRRTDVIFDLATMAWVTRDEMLLSVDVAVELRFRAGD